MNDIARIKKVNIILFVLAIFCISISLIQNYFLSGINDVIAIAKFISIPSIVLIIVFAINIRSVAFRYVLVITLYTATFATLYLQKGKIDNIFLLFCVSIVTVLYYDAFFIVFSMLLCDAGIISLASINKDLFFPLLSVDELSTLCVAFIMIGVVIYFQINYGKDLIAKSQQNEENQKQLNKKLLEVFDSISMASNALDGSIKKINDDTNITKTEIEQISSSIQETYSTIDDQTNRTMQSIDSLSKIRDAINQINDFCEDMTNTSILASEQIQDGKSLVEELVTQIYSIESTINIASDTVIRLNNQSNEINKIVEIISNISSQVDLLSLNASVEAARAGEAGRGFAVVASEIKRLSDKTSESVKSINTLIGNITQEIQNVTREITKGNESIKTGAVMTDTTNSYFNSVYDMVLKMKEKSQKVVSDINSLFYEYNAIFSGIEDIGSLTIRTTSNMEEISRSAQNQNTNVRNIENSLHDLISMSEKLKTLSNSLNK